MRNTNSEPIKEKTKKNWNRFNKNVPAFKWSRMEYVAINRTISSASE